MRKTTMSEEKIKKILDENTTAEELVVLLKEEFNGVVCVESREELAHVILRELDLDTESYSKKKYSEKLIMYILGGLAYGYFSVNWLRGIVEEAPILLKKKAKVLARKKELEAATPSWLDVRGVQVMFGQEKAEVMDWEKKIEEEIEKRVKCIYDLLIEDKYAF